MALAGFIACALAAFTFYLAGPSTMRIDSHHHIWNYDPADYPWIDDAMAKLRRDFSAVDWLATARAHDVTGAVIVQARQTLRETEWLLEVAAAQPQVLGVVGWVPLAAPEVAAELSRFSEAPAMKGVRHVVQDEPDDAFLLDEAFNRGVAQLQPHDLAYDLLIYARQLPAAIAFVDRHPEQRFIVDHFAKPTIQGGAIDAGWKDQIAQLAQRPHVACKVSGLATEVQGAVWSEPQLRPYWDTILEAFGSERLMFGSDWPVCLLRTEYTRWVETVEAWTAGLSSTEQQAIWRENARRWYKL